MFATLYYTDHHEVKLPATHKFPMRKYRLVRKLLEEDGLYSFKPAPMATPEVVALAHDRDYIEQFVAGTLPFAAMRRIGFPWSEALVHRTLASVGGTVAAAHDAVRTGFGGTLAGGTHHGFRAEGSGFCVFNDIAVAIYAVRRFTACLPHTQTALSGKDVTDHPSKIVPHSAHYERTSGPLRGIVRCAVIDLDVHQGDGTALIFRDDPDVLTLSMHGRNNFPFRKQQSKIDVELEDETGDDEYLRKLDGVLPQVTAFRPEMIFYQSGVDALACDKLGRLALSYDGLKRRDRTVIEFCRSLAVPFVITLGGGYGDPIEDTAEAHANTYRVAADVLSQHNSSVA